MKRLVCEMCKSNDILKQDGYYVCQYCGTKYTVEEARKMIIDGCVEVYGTVTIDDSEEIKKLYTVARNAREISDNKTALTYYKKIIVKDPESWEALFYSIILRTEDVTNGEILTIATTISDSLPKVFELIKEKVTDYEKKKDAIKEVIEQCYLQAKFLISASKNFLKIMKKINLVDSINGVEDINFGASVIDISSSFTGLGIQSTILGIANIAKGAGKNSKQKLENKIICRNIAEIMGICGDLIEENFYMADVDYIKYTIWSWKKMLELHYDFEKNNNEELFDNIIIEMYLKKIHNYYPSYKPPADNNEGCYVATCIYGSYDCPQVWTLRRFRDYSLAKTWYGRAFIHTYYAISPTIVKWFGNTNWFKNMWRDKLDKMVKKLQSKGYEDTPYKDKNWRK